MEDARIELEILHHWTIERSLLNRIDHIVRARKPRPYYTKLITVIAPEAKQSQPAAIAKKAGSPLRGLHSAAHEFAADTV